MLSAVSLPSFCPCSVFANGSCGQSRNVAPRRTSLACACNTSDVYRCFALITLQQRSRFAIQFSRNKKLKDLSFATRTACAFKTEHELMLLYFRWLSPDLYPSATTGSRFSFGKLGVLHRKEVIQPHLPIRLPCYDFTPIIYPTFGGWPLAVTSPTSGVVNSRGVTGGVYKTRERIHRGMLIRDY